MASQSHQLHFILFPFMAQGHMIPMVDIGRILAQHGVTVTIVTTPVNAKRFATTLARAVGSGLQIHQVEIKFPCQEVGLLDGCENVDMMPSLGLTTNFLAATDLLQEPVERWFEELKARPNCIISDVCLPYTSRIASKFRVPRISFFGFSTFSILCLHNIHTNKVLESITSESEPFVVPGLPDRIELTKKQLPEYLLGAEFNDKVAAAESGSCGLIINSFEELDPAYVQGYKKERGDKVWWVGPVSLSIKGNIDMIERGNKSSIDELECFKWLNSQQPRSVVYACLGSVCNLTSSQLIELGLGLEASNKPFIWVIRSGEIANQLENWLLNGFEERTKSRGLMIRGWAPQLAILSHSAIGGFLTHCGWNSTLEGITTGMPMVTWPLFGDQFCNEKLVVEVLGIGVSVGSKETVMWGEEETMGVLVKREVIKNAIDKLMSGGQESEERRKKAQELGRMAKKAVEEGGSSYLNVKQLIKDIVQQTV